MHEAESHYVGGDYIECLVSCRKAFFVEFEYEYDVTRLTLSSLLAGVEPYTRTPEYAVAHIHDPFDRIVLNHERVDADLAKEGIDNNAFWNVWRLTPDVYRAGVDGQWMVKHELKKVQNDSLKESASYVFDTMVDILLVRQMRRRSLRWIGSGEFFITLKQPSVPVYRKADDASEQIATTPPGSMKLGTQYATPGLRDDATYWKVFYPATEGTYVSGYVHERHVAASDS